MSVLSAYISYLRYVLRHKWHVAYGCWLLGAPLWQALIHDLSKFGPAEWGAYVNAFYAKRGDATARRLAFDVAWNHHQKVNPHHWQYWLLITDSDDPRLRPLPIPDRYVREMVADWYGAGMAISGKNDVEGWYLDNKEKIIFEPDTRARVEATIQRLMLSVVRTV